MKTSYSTIRVSYEMTVCFEHLFCANTWRHLSNDLKSIIVFITSAMELDRVVVIQMILTIQFSILECFHSFFITYCNRFPDRDAEKSNLVSKSDIHAIVIAWAVNFDCDEVIKLISSLPIIIACRVYATKNRYTQHAEYDIDCPSHIVFHAKQLRKQNYHCRTQSRDIVLQFVDSHWYTCITLHDKRSHLWTPTLFNCLKAKFCNTVAVAVTVEEKNIDYVIEIKSQWEEKSKWIILRSASASGRLLTANRVVSIIFNARYYLFVCASAAMRRLDCRGRISACAMISILFVGKTPLDRLVCLKQCEFRCSKRQKSFLWFMAVPTHESKRNEANQPNKQTKDERIIHLICKYLNGS